MTPRQEKYTIDIALIAGLVRLLSGVFSAFEPIDMHKDDLISTHKDPWCTVWFWGAGIAHVLLWWALHNFTESVKGIMHRQVFVEFFWILSGIELVGEISGNPTGFGVTRWFLFVCAMVYVYFRILYLIKNGRSADL